MNDIFTPETVRAHLPSSLLCLPIHIFDETGSTNTLARHAAEQGAPHGSLFAAASQTAGRGRRGRSFCSPDGTGLYVSLLLRPHMDPAHSIRITTAAAVALCRALETMGVADTSIKWVNDIFRGGRKIAGILTEASFTADAKMRYAVLGVGVNLSPPTGGFPPEIADIAGAAWDNPIPNGRARLLAAFLTEFFALYDTLTDENAAHMEEYRRRCFVLGQPVTVIPTGGLPSYDAVAEDIDEECRLLIRLPDGRAETLSTGEISVRVQKNPTA
jgi:BirA family biotin operon repressor/biotin-[acetyl-CoA-carboxylase] ligase